MNLIIDGIEITTLSSLNLKQTYSQVSNGTLLRMMDGTGVKQKAWGKVETTIAGNGWIPDGMTGIDFDNEVVVDCIANRSITSTNNVIAIPGSVRADVEPWAIAFVDGDWVSVGSSFVGGTLTVDVTPGATIYQARWMPSMIMFFDEPETETDRQDNVFSWSLSGQEV